MPDGHLAPTFFLPAAAYVTFGNTHDAKTRLRGKLQLLSIQSPPSRCIPPRIPPHLSTMSGAKGRDVVNHVLFEVATEVANRGPSVGIVPSPHPALRAANPLSMQSVVSTRSSSPRLR